MTHSQKAIVFDLDGVLIDSGEANYQAFAHGLEQLGLPRPTRTAVIELIGLKAITMLERLGCPQDQAPRVFEDFVQPYYLDNLPELAQAMPNGEQVLDELKARGYRILACTSGGRVVQTKALQSLGLWDYIEKMQTPEDSEFSKPDPRYFQELFAVSQPEMLFHVEDSETGIRMGIACGAVTVFSEYGYGTLPSELNVDYRISTLSELLAIAA